MQCEHCSLNLRYTVTRVVSANFLGMSNLTLNLHHSFIFPLISQLEHRAPFGVSVITHIQTHVRTPLDE
jgi:hypothetical protein